MYFCYFIFTSPWKKLGPFIWTNLSPHPPRMHCTKFCWNWNSVSAEKDFLILSMYFCDFVIVSPSEKAVPFTWTMLNPLYPRKHCAKFGWNWPSCSGEEEFFISSMYFSLFCNYLPLEKGGVWQHTLKKLRTLKKHFKVHQIWDQINALWKFFQHALNLGPTHFENFFNVR